MNMVHHVRLWMMEPREYKYPETHNEVDKQPKKVEIKFVIDKP
jgi:hypothetical protein